MPQQLARAEIPATKSAMNLWSIGERGHDVVTVAAAAAAELSAGVAAGKSHPKNGKKRLRYERKVMM